MEEGHAVVAECMKSKGKPTHLNSFEKVLKKGHLSTLTKAKLPHNRSETGNLSIHENAIYFI